MTSGGFSPLIQVLTLGGEANAELKERTDLSNDQRVAIVTGAASGMGRATAHLFARPVHAVGAVPSGVTPQIPRGVTATTHPKPASRVGGGLYRRPQSVSHIARPVAPTTTPAVGAVVVGALFGPAGFLHHTSGRPGHHDGPGAA